MTVYFWENIVTIQSLFTCRVLAFSWFPIGTSTREPAHNLQKENRGIDVNSRSPAAFQGWYVTNKHHVIFVNLTIRHIPNSFSYEKPGTLKKKTDFLLVQKEIFLSWKNQNKYFVILVKKISENKLHRLVVWYIIWNLKPKVWWPGPTWPLFGIDLIRIFFSFWYLVSSVF